MPRPTLGTAPTVDEVAAVDCPVERFTRITRVAQALRTLPSGLARLRRASLQEALTSHTATEIATRAELSLGRISQLRPVRTEAAA